MTPTTHVEKNKFKGHTVNIDLHIDEFILPSVSPADRHRIVAAVERELARLLTEQGIGPHLLQNLRAVRLDGGTLDANPGVNPEATGVHIAQSIYSNFS